MNLHIPIHIPTDHEPLFLCSWNDGEIVQIHNEKSFMEEYKDSLNDHFDDYMFYKFLCHTRLPSKWRISYKMQWYLKSCC